MADGSIKIKTEIDNSDLRKGIDETVKTIKKEMEKGIGDTEANKEIVKVAEEYEKVAEKLSVVAEVQDKVKVGIEQTTEATSGLSEELTATSEATKSIVTNFDKASFYLSKVLEEAEQLKAQLATEKSALFDLSETQAQVNAVNALLDDTNIKISAGTKKEIIQMNDEFAQSQASISELASEFTKLEIASDGISEGMQMFKEIGDMQMFVSEERELTKVNQRMKEIVAEAQKLKGSMVGLGGDIKGVEKDTGNVVKPIITANTETKKLGKSMQVVKTSAKSVNDTMAKGVKTMLKWAGALFGVRAMYSAIRKVFGAWVNETKEGAQAQADLNRITSSFANLLAPAFQTIISLLNTMLSYINAITKSLFGFEIITNKSSKNLNKSTKEAKKLNKELKQTASFDEMEVLSSSGSSGGASSGTSEVLPSELPKPDVSWWTDSIAKIIKALDPFIKIIKSIDFKPLQKSFANYVKSMQGLLRTLGDSFVRIMNNSIGPFIKLVSEDIAPKWLDTMAKAIETITPALDNVLHNLVEPLINWFLLDFVPVAFDLLVVVFDIMNNVLTILIESIMLFWNTIGKDIAFLGGELIVAIFTDITNFLEDVNEGFTIFIEKLREGDPLASGLAFAIGLIVAGLVAYKVAMLAVNAVTAIFAAISPFGWIAIAIGAVVAIIALLYAKWDDITKFFETSIKNIGDFFGGLGKWIKDVMNGAWDSMKTGASNAWNAIKNIFGTVGKFFKDTFSNAWNAVKDIFSTGGKIFSGITDGIVSAFKSIVNTIIDGINRVVKIPFDGINGALNTLKKISILGAKPFGFLPTITVPQIPRLAKGTYTTGAMTAVIGEAGREAVVPLQNNTEWIHDFIELFNANGGGASGAQTIVLQTLLDGKVVAETVNDINNENNFQTNGRGGLNYGY